MQLPIAAQAMRAVLGAMLYFPTHTSEYTPGEAGLTYRDLDLEAEDGERLHGWWIDARGPAAGHILFCHGNAGNIADRVAIARLLAGAGFDVLLFDYRGYGQSSGKPDEEGTYRDARSARTALLAQPDLDPARVFYLGESLGGAIALNLAVESPPRGLILQSAFSSIRDAARRHFPLIPTAVIPDAYPSLRRIAALSVPLLVLHGDRDLIVPLAHGHALFDAAPVTKRMHVFAGLGHNDVVERAGREYADTIASWVRELDR